MTNDHACPDRPAASGVANGEVRVRARTMWHLLETIHAVVYFAPEVTASFERAGLRGFWRGYFAGRAAPLGETSADVVTAAFFNFHPAMVARAIPEVWQTIAPQDAIDARLAGVDTALRPLLGSEIIDSGNLATAADLARRAVEECSIDGRTFFAAHLDGDWPAAAHLRLWHAATLLREHRGDGHIAANLAAGVDGLTTLVTACAAGDLPRSAIQPHRGWSDEQWDHATRTLTDNGVLDERGLLTDPGRLLRHQIETTTDQLAAEPWARLGVDHTERLGNLLEPIAATITRSGTLPYPNPMALPRLSTPAET